MIDYSFKLDTIISGGTLAILAFGLKRIYEAISGFVSRQKENEETISITSRVVDTHSRVLLKRGIMDGPVEQCHRRRWNDPKYVEEQV